MLKWITPRAEVDDWIGSVLPRDCGHLGLARYDLWAGTARVEKQTIANLWPRLFMKFAAQRATSTAGFILRIPARRDPQRSICLRLRKIACASLPADEPAALVRAVSSAKDRRIRFKTFHGMPFWHPSPRFMNNPG